jgi:hypothetical protein
MLRVSDGGKTLAAACGMAGSDSNGEVEHAIGAIQLTIAAPVPPIEEAKRSAHPLSANAATSTLAIVRERAPSRFAEADGIGAIEAAELARVSRSTIARAWRSGELPIIAIHGDEAPKFDPRTVRAWARKKRLIA